MDENRSSTDLDDAEILAKFRNLLSKYQNHGRPVRAAPTTISPTATTADEALQEAQGDKIPVLAEVVILHPSVIPPQSKRSIPMRQILDAALHDTHIEISASDKEALANALEIRLADQTK
jgi:hypothetical protein